MEVALYNENKSDQEISALSASDIHQANSREYCKPQISSYNLFVLMNIGLYILYPIYKNHICDNMNYIFYI